MKINATLILGGWVHEIIGKPRNCRKLMSRCWIEIGISAAGIDGAVPQTEIGQAHRVIIAHRDVSGDVGHEIIDPHIPLQRRLGIEVAEAGHGIADTVGSYQTERRQRGRECPVDVCTRTSDDRSHLHGQLAAEDRRRKYIARNDDREICAGVQIRIEVDVQSRVKSADLDLAGCSNIGARTYGCMIVNRRDCPSRCTWHCRETSVCARKPKAGTAFIGQRNRRRGGKNADTEQRYLCRQPPHCCLWSEHFAKTIRIDAVHLAVPRCISERMLVILRNVSAQSSKFAINMVALMQGGHGQKLVSDTKAATPKSRSLSEILGISSLP